MIRYPRDLHGYGSAPPDPCWPGNARIAVQFVLNYEEGGERCLLHGDDASEAFLSEIPAAQSWPGERHWNMESVYDYGARAGFWRLHRLFTEFDVPVTVFGVATALARSPAQVAAMRDAHWEIACHGLKWIEHRSMAREAELQAMEAAVALHTQVVGEPPAGWYTGRCSMRTIELACELGSFEYLSDSYDDDLPHWLEHGDRHQLIIPYTLDANDMRFAPGSGFVTSSQFGDYLCDAFDVLYAEGVSGAPKLLSVGLHCRLLGRPGRAGALARFLDHARRHEGVWFARRIDVARHWAATHPPVSRLRPSRLEKPEFLELFGAVFEGGSWIAEQTFEGELGPAQDTAIGLHAAMVRVFRAANASDRRDILNAHPDLAGQLARRRMLSSDSTREQADAGLAALTDEEFARFERANASYRERHGFPFIIAARDHDKDGILAAIAERTNRTTSDEFAEACVQVERIAELRLAERLP